MLDRKTMATQKQVKAACEEVLHIQEDIGRLLELPIVPGDPGAVFRCRLVLNRCSAAANTFGALRAKLPMTRDTVISHALISRNEQILKNQKHTVSSLIECIRLNNAAALEAKRAALAAESILIGERIKNNV